MLEGLLIVLTPMFLGYLIKTTNNKFLLALNRILMLLLYSILFLMGYNLGQLENLAQKLPIIALSALGFSLIIHLCNFISLMLYDKFFPFKFNYQAKEQTSHWQILKESFKLCFMVVIGVIVGIFTQSWFHLPSNSSTYLLMLLIFLVGIQLRNSGIALRSVLFNRRGINTAIIMIASSLIGGLIAAYLLDFPLPQALAIASGLGWYSLSSVIINDSWGAMLGSIAFLNDLSREILSLFLIPLFMPYYRSTAVGVAGATALDCTLPIIQRAGGIAVVPLAISFGFITNIISPLLLVFFSSIPLN